MNKYESVIIISPKINKEETEKIIDKITNLINSNGEVTSVEKLGIKKLAYEIMKNKEGYYVVIYFKAETSFITELERYYKINENIIKFITVRKDD